MKDNQNEARLEDNLRAETSMSLAVAESRNKELALKLAIADKDRRSVEVGLRTGKAQVGE